MKKTILSFILLPFAMIAQASVNPLSDTNAIKVTFGNVQENILLTDLHKEIDNSISYNSFVSQQEDYTIYAKIGIGSYSGYTLEKNQSSDKSKRNVIKMDNNVGLNLHVNPYLSLVGEVGMEGNLIDFLGENSTTEYTVYAQPGVRFSPLGDKRVHLDILQPYFSQKTEFGTFNPEAKMPLVRLSSNWDINKNTKFTASLEYMETQKSDNRFSSRHNAYYYQPESKRSSINVSFKHKF